MQDELNEKSKTKKALKRIGGNLLCILFSILCMCGCGEAEENPLPPKIKDIEFTVVAEDKLPEELKTQIELNKEKPIEMVFEKEDYIYLVKGYGPQPKPGYSIQIEQLYQSTEGICIQTKLIENEAEEDLSKTTTYPYIVVKLERYNQNIVFFH